MKKISLCTLTALASGLLGGCMTPGGFDIDSSLRVEAAGRAKQRESAPVMVTKSSPRIVESAEAYIPVTARKVSENSWLRAKQVTLRAGNGAVPLSEVLRVLANQGVTLASELPLERYSYSGYSLTNVDAETALRTILLSVGLDYHVDNARRLVVVKPLSSRTWYLNIGNRRSTYASGTAANTESGSLGANFGKSSTGGNATTQSTGTSTILSDDNFWASLKSELDTRLKVMLPDPPKADATSVAGGAPAWSLPPIPVPAGAGGGGLPPLVTQGNPDNAAARPAQVHAGALPAKSSAEPLAYNAKTVGTYSVNPETGAVTVQAPQWMMAELDDYFKRVQDMYNTDVVFTGELVMLTTESQRSEGLDISAFAKFANSRYGVAFANNALGGVTLSFPSGGSVPALSAGQGLAGPLVGLVSAADGLSMFNAYLTNLGRVTTLQKPVLTTTSGVPADFRRTVTRYFNSVSQQAASGGSGSAAVGTQNTLIAQDFGTILRVNPRIDVSTGLIRAQIELVQTSQTGTQNVSQALSTGNSVQQVTTPLPVVSKIIYSGEALLRDGDLIVMGGQTEDTESANRDGVTDLVDNPAVGGLFGVTKQSAARNVFYFAMRVSVNKR